MDFLPDALRAARALLELDQSTVAGGAGVERRVVIRLERGDFIRPPQNAYKLVNFYEKSGILFLEADQAGGIGVRWKTPRPRTDLFKRSQLLAARALAHLTQAQLAQRAGVDRSVLTRFESSETKSPAPIFIQRVRDVFGELGVLLLQDTDQGFGVRWKAPELSSANIQTSDG
ncbi:hypothetical protein ASC90_25560 [Rhizobium sp. Root1220]|nr:hypothetical protein ASC90_25560 [Rhizobium sp. Root1220]